MIDALPGSVLEKRQDADLYAEAAQAYWRLDEKNLCKESAEKAIALNPEQAKAHNYLGNVLGDKSETDKAIEEYKKAIDIDPKFAYPYNGLGNVYDTLKQYHKAIEAYNKAIEIDPKYAYPYNGLGNVHDSLKQYDKAIDAYSKAIDIDSRYARAYNGLGIAYGKLEKYEKAIEVFNKILEFDPQNIMAYNNLGYAYYRLNQTDKALQFYNKAIDFDEDFAMGYRNIGIVYAHKKQYIKAIEFYTKAIGFYNKAAELEQNFAFVYNDIGNAYADLNQYDKAVENYNKSIKLNSKSSYPYNGLANMYSDFEQYEKAITTYTQSLEIDPDFADAYYNRALAFFNNKQYKQAKKDYEKYISITDNEDDIYAGYAKERIEELNKLIGDEAFGEITTIVNKIKKVLLFKDDCVTHYTTMTALSFLVLKKSPQRLSEGAYLNDTSEGRELFKYLDFETDIRKGQDTDAELFAVKPFIGSFVAESKYDDLTLWRMYGKENKEEAKGCAVTMQRKILIEKIKEKLLAGKMDSGIAIDGELQFYRVAYRDKDAKAKPFSIPGRDVKPATITKFNNDMAELKLKVIAYEADRKDKPADRQKLKELLNEIAYLFKSVEYQYEHEVRLIIKGIGFDKIVDQSVTPSKVYIELVPIAPAIKKITLGPKVEKADEWASALYYSLANEMPDKKDKAEILISHLPYK